MKKLYEKNDLSEMKQKVIKAINEFQW